MVQMRRSVDLDAQLETELSDVVSLTKEKPAVVIRQALRAGLPTVANRFQSPRPAGYFSRDYGPDKERVALESAMSKVLQKTRTMNLHQWEIWKCRPPGFARDHWFVVSSGQERLDNPYRMQEQRPGLLQAARRSQEIGRPPEWRGWIRRPNGMPVRFHICAG